MSQSMVPIDEKVGTPLSFRERLKLLVKSTTGQFSTKAALGLPFPGYGGGQRAFTLRMFFPGTRKDYIRRTNPIWTNSAVSDCIAWTQRAFSEAQIQVNEIDSEEGVSGKRITNHSFTKAWRRPGKRTCPQEIMNNSLFSWWVDGNSFLYQTRNKFSGKVQGFQYIPHWMLEPDWDPVGVEFINRYIFFPIHGTPREIPAENIVHFRFGFDPRNIRRGLSPLFPCLPEVDSDNEARNYTDSILSSMGAPGVFISPKDSSISMDDDARKDLESWYISSTTGDNRGKPLIASVPVDLTPYGFSPEDLNLDKIRQIPEDRIASAFGIPPMVVGLTSGSSSKTYANYREAREAAMEQCVFPTQALFAQQLTAQSLPEFDDDPNHEVGWDYRNCKSLQDQYDKLWQRVNTAFKGSQISRDEARVFLGLLPLGGPPVFVPLTAVASQGNTPNPANDTDGLGRPKNSGGGDKYSLRELTDMAHKAMETLNKEEWGEFKAMIIAEEDNDKRTLNGNGKAGH